MHLRRRAAERSRLLALAAADRLPGARRLRRVRVLPGRHLRPLRGSAAAAGQRRPGRGRGRPAAGRPGGPRRAARRHRRGVDPRPGPPGRLLARPRPHGAGPDAGRLVPDRRPRPGRRRRLRARRRAGLDHDHPRRQQRLAGRGRGRPPGPSRRPGGGRGRAAGRAVRRGGRGRGGARARGRARRGRAAGPLRRPCWPATRCRRESSRSSSCPATRTPGRCSGRTWSPCSWPRPGRRSNRDRHAAGRRGAAGAAGRARPRALRHPRGRGRGPGGAGRRRAGRAPRAGQHRAAGLGSRRRVAAGRGRAGGLPADLPALRRAPRRRAARAGDDPRPHRPRRQPLPAGGRRHLPEHRAPRARGRPRRAAGQAPPHAAGAGDGHDPGRRGARRRGSVRPPSRSRSAPTSSSRRSAGTWPSTGSTWSSARR